VSAETVLEAALRNDVAECEKRVVAATPKPVISKGKLLHRGSNAALERAERELDKARARLEHWLGGRGR
jgi:hypothetical protein